MFDTMTFTKITGALCGSLLIFMLGGFAAETIYHGGGHGDGEQAYVIPVEGAASTEAPVEEGPAFAELFAVADVAEGESAFRACQACHSLEAGANGTGPSLYGVVGRAPGSMPDFSYSAGFEAVNAAWTPEEIDHFIANPKGYASETIMGYNGMRSATDRANLIAYLDSIDG